MPDHESQDALPPQDLDAEQAVLGACLLAGSAMDTVAAHLDITDFYREAHRIIYGAMLEVVHRECPADLVTVAAELRRTSNLESVGGGEYMTYLIDHCPTPEHATRYASIVRQKAILRQLITAGAEIQALGYANPAEPTVAVDLALSRLEEIQERCHVNGRLRSMSDGSPEAMERMELRRNRPYEVSTAKFGIGELDRLTGGLEDAGYCVLLGDTGEGKTSLLVQIVMATSSQIQNELSAHENTIAALRRGGDEEGLKRERKLRDETRKKCVLIFGMEEGQWRWHLRMASFAGGFDTRECRNMPTFAAASARYADLEQSYWSAFSEVAALPVEFGQDEQTISTIEAQCKRVAKDRKPVLIVVDYLQQIGHADRSLDRVSQLGDIAVRLRRLSDRLKCPIIASSQVTRTAEGSPVTKDAKSLEQSADTKIVIERKHDPKTGDLMEECRLLCKKSKEFTHFKPFKCLSDFHTGRWTWDDRPAEEEETRPKPRRRPRDGYQG